MAKPASPMRLGPVRPLRRTLNQRGLVFPCHRIRGIVLLLLVLELACVPQESSPRRRGDRFVWRFQDPALACDDAGHVYVASTELFDNQTQIFLATSSRYGESWDTQFHYLNDSLEGERGRPQLSVGAEGQIFALWEDTRDGAVDLYFNRSLDAGRTWLSQDVRINSQSRRSNRHKVPRLVSDENGNVAVVWLDDRDGFMALYSNSSRDHGENWLRSEVRITSVSLEQKSAPSLFQDESGGLYVTWIEMESGEPVVRFNRSHDHGETWMIESTRLSGSGAGITFIDLPSLCALESGAILVTWLEIRNGRADVLLTRSLDRGRTWQALPQVVQANLPNLFDPSAPLLTCDRYDHVYLSWQVRSADRGNVIILKTSNDAGRSFRETLLPLGEAPFAIPEANLPLDRRLPPFQMASDETGNVYFTWLQTRSGPARVGFERVSNYGQSWLGLGQTLELSGHAPRTLESPRVCADDYGHVYVLWNEGQSLTVAASPFFGDSGWRYEHF